MTPMKKKKLSLQDFLKLAYAEYSNEILPIEVILKKYDLDLVLAAPKPITYYTKTTENGYYFLCTGDGREDYRLYESEPNCAGCVRDEQPRYMSSEEAATWVVKHVPIANLASLGYLYNHLHADVDIDADDEPDETVEGSDLPF